MKKSKFTARDVEVLSRISAALQVIDHDVTELNAVLLKVGERVKEPVKPSKKLPEIGDKILITDDVYPYISKGDIALVIEVNEALEIVADAPPVPEGSLFSLSFQGTKEGVGAFKRELRKMTGEESLPAMTLNEYFGMLESEIEFSGRISYRKFKDREFINLRIL